jgi:hypothetical protein
VTAGRRRLMVLHGRAAGRFRLSNLFFQRRGCKPPRSTSAAQGIGVRAVQSQAVSFNDPLGGRREPISDERLTTFIHCTRRPVRVAQQQDRDSRVAWPLFGLIGDAILPTAPDNPDPSPGQEPNGMRVVAGSTDGLGTDLSSPGAAVPRIICERGHGPPKRLIARPAKLDRPALASVLCHRALASQCRYCFGAVISLAAVAPFGQPQGIALGSTSSTPPESKSTVTELGERMSIMGPGTRARFYPLTKEEAQTS